MTATTLKLRQTYCRSVTEASLDFERDSGVRVEKNCESSCACQLNDLYLAVACLEKGSMRKYPQ